MKKTFLAILLNFSLILLLTGCRAEVFDASGYTKACLDAVYHEEYEAYTTFVGCTIDEAKADMDEQSRLSVNNELSSLDIAVTKEQADKYLILLKEIENLAKYEIGQAEVAYGIQGPVKHGYIDINIANGDWIITIEPCGN